MDRIKAQVVSSKPVSLSLVSSIFERFLSSDNGTNREVFACLKRSAVTIDNLIQAKALKFKQEMGQNGGTPHETLDKKQPLDGHDRNEGKEELGFEGNIVDVKTGSTLGKLGRKEQSACGAVCVDDLEKSYQSKQKKRTKKLESFDETRWLKALGRDSNEENDEVVENSEREHGKKNKKHHRLLHNLDQDMLRNELKMELRQHQRKELRKRHKQHKHIQESVQTEGTRWEKVQEDKRKKMMKEKVEEEENGGLEGKIHRQKGRKES